MGFGEFHGTVAHREQRDLLWVLAFTLLLKESVYERLYAAGIQLPTGPAVMEDFKTYEVRPEYRRIVEIKPVKSLAIQSLEFAEASNCPECGTQIKKRPKRLFLKKTAVPADEPIFAVEETDQVIANEKFQEAVKKLKFKNIAFDPVELI